MVVGPMTDRLGALLAENPGLERASRLTPRDAPRPPGVRADCSPTRDCVRERRRRSPVSARHRSRLSLVAKASKDSWTASVGLPALGLRAADELGIDLDRFVVVDDPGKQWIDVLAALVDAFDVVLAHPPATRHARKVGATGARAGRRARRGRPWAESDVRIAGCDFAMARDRRRSRTPRSTHSRRDRYRTARRHQTGTQRFGSRTPTATSSLFERDNVVRLRAR